LNTEAIPKNLDEWVELIRQREMPIFDHTVHQVIAFADDDLAPISELAGVILRDASLTTRVLKLANSIYYNPTGVGISTITRAVIVLGFNVVRDMCLAVTLVDALVKGAARERLGRELARSLHSAAQARALAAARGDKSPEEIFIATLLTRIGEMAFWCFSGEVGEKLERLSGQPGITAEQAQEKLLGFRLSHLSRQLIKEWHLTELLQKAVSHPSQKDERMQTVMLGQQIARCAEEKGWRSNEMNQLVLKAARLTELTVDDARELLYEKAQAATRLAADLGASFAAVHIPQPGPHTFGAGAPVTDQSEQPPVAASPPLQPLPDGALRIRILRELGAFLDSGQCDFNLIMELVLEGIYHGVGMDRVLFALTTPDKQAIKAKYALGQGQEELTKGFHFVRAPNAPDILFQTMDRKLPHWMNARECEVHTRLIPDRLIHLVGHTPFMLAPVIVNHQCIGLFYTDRGLSGRPLDAASYDDFKHFVNQANMGLTLAVSRPRRKS
jgi:HD-like signal output (HDOD) protein